MNNSVKNANEFNEKFYKFIMITKPGKSKNRTQQTSTITHCASDKDVKQKQNE